MAKISRKVGTTSQTVTLFIQDSTSTTGAGKTGLAYNTASLTAYYVRPRSSAVAITLATQTATGVYSSGGFVEIDSTNLPGFYRLDIPDAALASGSDAVAIMLKGATGMAPLTLEIELTAWDNQDATRGGLTALPNANAGANGGLPLSVDASGRVDVLKINGASQTARDIGASVLLSSGTGTGQISLTAGAVTLAAATHTGAVIPTVTNLTNLPAITAGWLTATGIASSALDGKGDWTTDADLPVNFNTLSLTNGQTMGTSTYAGGDTNGTTILLNRLTSIRADNLDNLDAAISTRLATVSYSAPPSSSTIAGAVRTELAVELGRIDVATSSRFAAATWTSAWPAHFTNATFSADGVFATTALVNAPSGGGGGATAADIWAYSSRTLSTEPPTAIEIRQEMDLNSTKLQSINSLASSISVDTTDLLVSAATKEEIRDAVLNALLADHNTPGTIGAGIGNASSAGDPWSTTGLDTYPAGSAGYGMNRIIQNPGTGPVVTIPGPSEAGKCIAYAYTQDFIGTSRAGIEIAVSLGTNALPAYAGDYLLETTEKVAVTDETGYAAFTLPASANITPAGSVWIFNCPDLGLYHAAVELEEGVFDLKGLVS